MLKLNARKSAFAGLMTTGLAVSMSLALMPVAVIAQDRDGGFNGRDGGYHGERDERGRVDRDEVYRRNGSDDFRYRQDDRVGTGIGFHGYPAPDPDDAYNPFKDCDYIVDDCY